MGTLFGLYQEDPISPVRSSGAICGKFQRDPTHTYTHTHYGDRAALSFKFSGQINMEAFRRQHSHVVFLEIGTNDLAASLSPTPGVQPSLLRECSVW